MGNVSVDQLLPSGVLVQDVDTTLSDSEKTRLLLTALPGATVESIGRQKYVLWNGHALLYKQITYLGIPWDSYKKRIQIPKQWLEAYDGLAEKGLQPHFVGIYCYRDTVVFGDFSPVTYLRRKANNSAAHVFTNDLFQAIQQGSFERIDKNQNLITTVRGDAFAAYLSDRVKLPEDPRFAHFRDFNEQLFTGLEVHVLDAVREMTLAQWPDRFQGEWAGFYLEYKFDEFVKKHSNSQLPLRFVKVKTKATLDFDIEILSEKGEIEFLGDLKSSDVTKFEAPGNDKLTLEEALKRYGRLWYVIYEHETKKARDFGDLATRAWNEYRWANGLVPRKNEQNPLSYASRLKQSIRYTGMKVLEVNSVNRDLVLGDFHQGVQQSGAARNVKVNIKKRQIENFVVYSEESHHEAAMDRTDEE